MLRVLCPLVVLAGLATPAHADGRKRALELFAESDKAYKNGDFEQAATLLREAYGLHPEPILLYNLARALEGMGDTKGAIDAYKQYLGAQATIEDRGAIERRVTTLEEQLAAKAAAEAKPAPPPPDPPPPQPQPPPPAARHSALPLITLGGGVAIGLTGGAFGLFARSRHQAAIDEPKQADAKSLNDAAQRYATTANVLMVAGGVIAIGGTIWLIVDRSRSPGPPKVGLVVGPGSIGVAGVWP